MTESLIAAVPRGRVRLADLAPGERYFSLYSATGRCFYRTRNEDEARDLVAKDPAKRSYMGYTR